jgi:2-keto-4-pentenoate hydratase/2-oxohepta-3-ene-1,7-dioic acid hydratase in catechol pathway
MKLCTYAPRTTDEPRLGLVLSGGRILDAAAAGRSLGLQGQAAAALRSIKDCAAAAQAGLDTLRQVLNWAENSSAAGPFTAMENTVVFYPPVPDPGKFLCVGKNSKHHLDELARTQLIREVPNEPTGFIKLPGCLVGHNAKVARPPDIVEFDYEPEMAFVVGKAGFRVPKERALDHVFGITVLNDLTAREIQRREVVSGTRFWTAKNMPGFGPVGPYVVTLDEIGNPDELYLSCRVNGEQRNRFSTGDLIYKIPEIIEHFSRFLPLEVGDLFSTGTAGGVAAAQANASELFLKPGDVVDAAIENVMTLRTHIV